MAAASVTPAPINEPIAIWERWRRAVREFLHSGGARGDAWQRLPPYAPALQIALCGLTYGAIMGGYNGVSGDRAIMVLYGALKIPMLFLVTMLIAVPGFYVLN